MATILANNFTSHQGGYSKGSLLDLGTFQININVEINVDFPPLCEFVSTNRYVVRSSKAHIN
jgi:hypothetical protein